MPTELTPEDRRAKVLADLQEAINDKDALLRNPEAHTGPLTEQVKAAYRQGVIDADDQRGYLEWIDSAQAWAVEELLTRELNQ
ncbi:hypothetical protein [Pseudomonas sp. AB6]|uniref:hypothetical protein n=1 Tax=Pseudomonas sp. AB6 TaxID=3048598 RepID=UPI002AB37F53|nr:hypothetical protein [Pseudomonas sp. AB6]MDY7563460.1 hypothetical protein [Pseudomonas sp. AB6]MEB0213467.1 hypothetical protein [Pseudomonas sp. AB6]